jgi:hypothetical protein
MKMLRREKWHDGLVVTIKNDNLINRNWVILFISKEIINNTSINALEEGYYAFGGMWYGDDPKNYKSYGKIITLDNEEELFFNGVIDNYNLQELKALVD